VSGPAGAAPYGKAVGRTTRWGDELFGYLIGARDQDLIPDGRNSSAFAPLAEVVQSAFPWDDDRPLRTPWHKTLIYEAHVKGMTAREPGPRSARGSSTPGRCPGHASDSRSTI
jgi:isoamylase